MNGYNGECIKGYVRDYHNIRSHIPTGILDLTAAAYALVYLCMRINEVLDLCNGLHTNA